MEENKSVAKDDAIHLSLVISGAVSLGTYEAGALVKLIRAVRATQQPDYTGQRLMIDVIAGASAGAMTGAMVAYCLLTGVREDILYNAWVNDIALEKLENKYGKKSVLSSRQIEDLVNKYLKDPKRLSPDYYDRRLIQNYPIRLIISLTNLNGRNFPIQIHLPDDKIETFNTFTYKDWIYYDLLPGGEWEEKAWESIKKSAQASGAFPVAFEPVRIEDWAQDDQGLADQPESFLFTDGGVLNNQPLGLAIDASYNPQALFRKPLNADRPISLSSGKDRYFVLIQPTAGEKSPSSGIKEFSSFKIAIDSLASIPRHQSLYEDLKRLERINQQIKWNNDFLSSLDVAMKDVDKDSLRSLEDLLKNMSQKILGDKKERAPESKKRLYDFEAQKELQGDQPELIKYFRLYTNLVSMMRGKQMINVYVIRPTEKEGGEKDILAGEFLGYFGGFLSRELRSNDFIVGYQNAEDWLAHMGFNNLAGSEIKIYDFRQKKEFVVEKDARLGEMSFKDLPYGIKLKAYFTGIKGVEVLTYDFSQKHQKYGNWLNLFVGFLRMISYPLAMLGGGFWTIVAVVIFIVGVVHSAFDIKNLLNYLQFLCGAPPH